MRIVIEIDIPEGRDTPDPHIAAKQLSKFGLFKTFEAYTFMPRPGAVRWRLEQWGEVIELPDPTVRDILEAS